MADCPFLLLPHRVRHLLCHLSRMQIHRQLQHQKRSASLVQCTALGAWDWARLEIGVTMSPWTSAAPPAIGSLRINRQPNRASVLMASALKSARPVLKKSMLHGTSISRITIRAAS
ncbi:hypothetical protein BKA81DRAFT_343744 [Phyllosticta paracitricarpa]